MLLWVPYHEPGPPALVPGVPRRHVQLGHALPWVVRQVLYAEIIALIVRNHFQVLTHPHVLSTPLEALIQAHLPLLHFLREGL